METGAPTGGTDVDQVARDDAAAAQTTANIAVSAASAAQTSANNAQHAAEAAQVTGDSKANVNHFSTTQQATEEVLEDTGAPI